MTQSHTFFYLINRYKLEFNSNHKAFAQDLVKQGYSKVQIAEIGEMTRRHEADHKLDYGKKFEVKGAL